MKGRTPDDNTEGGPKMLVGGIVVGIACAMYTAAIMDMEDVVDEDK